ncbi:uncharacterized protein N7459_004284 [Penicillium hispanicum]|uniref:uncharacterized protein n=1 Tax=Penicillium hispanicum TaxID=1080232 RepID=UPI0025424788|nr:uncharacterized protein N7459_004284 [Penicillium hispanicum]KAJ5584484.1 hypothetical protein N7459_004284 [Penicillium hispanicum]
MQRRRELLSSPLKRSNTTPNIRSKAREILDEDEDDAEEDEETLQLQLAEIQARLKLKQLQKTRGRSGTATSHTDDEDGRCSSRAQSHASIPRSPPRIQRKAYNDEVQVPVSPTRREPTAPEPWSPRRYQMGIDKGWKASDVSLKRPPSSRTDPRPSSQLGTRSGAVSRSGDIFPPRPQTSPASGGMHKIKSFSERMAEGRAAEKSRMERAERVQANRSSAFRFDKSEIESFKTAAANEKPLPPSPAFREPEAQTFSREEILQSLGKPRSAGLKRSQTTPNVRKMASEEVEGSVNPPDSSKFESYSSLHLSNRILPHSFLSRNLADKTVLRIPDLLKTIKAPSFELPEEIDGDFVVFGIVASKSEPRQTKESGNASAKTVDPYDDGLNNTNKYMAITLTDLKWTIDLFLFDTAFPRYYKISEGTLIAILNPTIMPPPKQKLDTNRFSLALSSSDDKVLEIGYARDIGFCKAVRKDGKTCQSWVDGRKTEFCDFHVDIQVRRTQGQRMGVNGNTGMFGPGGQSGSRTGFWSNDGGKRGGGGGGRGAGARQGLKPEGPQYHWGSQSTYYVAPAPKSNGAGRASFNPVAAGQSTASLIDASDDPFIAAGMMGRGMENKEERLRRRLATQQRERDITQKLVSGRAGGVGAEYLRTRTTDSTSANGNKDQAPRTPTTPKALPSSNSGISLASFGKAKNVRLSPMKRAHDGDKPHGSSVKKTRFITSKGIREAGRDSLGGPADTTTGHRRTISEDDDDDDELDII